MQSLAGRYFVTATKVVEFDHFTHGAELTRVRVRRCERHVAQARHFESPAKGRIVVGYLCTRIKRVVTRLAQSNNRDLLICKKRRCVTLRAACNERTENIQSL